MCFAFEVGGVCPGTHFVDQGDLVLRDSLASTSVVLGIKGVQHHNTWFFFFFFEVLFNHKANMGYRVS